MTQIAADLRFDLISEMPIEQVFQKHLIDGSSHYFKDELKQANLEYELRHNLSNSLQISINDIVIVGSAKLGFSVKSSDFTIFDGKFKQTGNPHHRSDIDVAIVNKRLFDLIAEQIFRMSRHFDRAWIYENWRLNLFHKTPTNLFQKYTYYLARGWLRPDLLPTPYLAQAGWAKACDEWYRRLGKRRVSVGFYSEWFYLKHYQMDNLNNIRTKIKKLEM